MLAFFACSCVRFGRRLSAPAAKLCVLSPVRISPRTPILTSRLLARCLSVGSQADAGSLGCPSDPGDGEVYGSLSADMSSRRSFRKSSPEIQDLRHGDEEDSVKARRRPGRRNTPYWYFLQCKTRIRQNKVGRVALPCCVLLSPSCVYKRLCSSRSCRRLWTCSARTCWWERGCSRRSTTTRS